MLVGAVVYAGLDPDSGLRTWWQLRGELAASRGRIEALEGEITRLSEAARDLDGDPHAMERAIREDLGLARPGEIIVLFSGLDPSSTWIP